ncbi:hypothetical protein RJD24_14790 [Bacillaceae bacterium IKA-2]|nr:hypothetical protein RJD24_14790 [Bacillaceae bacterium IKA-2]
MSMPNIPNINPKVTITKKKALNLLLSSIALEEIGLSHILNAEAEKLQVAIKKYKKNKLNFEDFLSVNHSIDKTLRGIIKNQMLLQFKLEDVVELYQTEGFEDDCDK